MNYISLAGACACAALALTVTTHSHAVPPGTPTSFDSHYHQAFLRPFPASQLPGAYGLSFRDEYHFALPYAEDAIQYAAYRVYQHLGEAAVPMQICDCSTVSGTTPLGRHPRGAHDGGQNFDVTYFMKRPVDDFIVCPSHADNHCTGAPLDLDVERQAYFFAVLGELDDEVGEGLIQKMAVDGRVLEVISPELERLEASGSFSRSAIRRANQLVYGEMTDLGTGWYRFHHNHTHLRFYWRAQDQGAVTARIQYKISRLISIASRETPLP